MFYLKIYFLISLFVFIFFFGKFLYSGDIKSIKNALKKILVSSLVACLWLPFILFLSITETMSYFDHRKWDKDAKNLSNLITSRKNISDDYIFNNRMGLNPDDFDKLKSAYSDIFKIQDSHVRIEYIEDLIDGMKNTADDGSDLLKLLQETNTTRRINRQNFRKSLGEKSHVSYKSFDTRLFVTTDFANSFNKIKSLESFLSLCKSILDANKYLGTSWNPNNELPDHFRLNGLLLTINVCENLCLFISTASDCGESFPKACLLLLTEPPKLT